VKWGFFANYQTLGGAGFSVLAMGRMIRKVVSKGISTGIKATNGKGRGTKRTTRISVTATSRRINIILTNHFRFWRFIRMSLLPAGSPGKLCTVSVQELVQQNEFYRIVDVNSDYAQNPSMSVIGIFQQQFV
jgi:hypothetical protein